MPDDRPTNGPVLRLDTFLPYRVSVLANTISQSVALAYRNRFGLSVPEWRVMATLGEQPDGQATLCANAVAARTAMDKVQVSRAIARLSTNGLVARASDPADRRRGLLALTAEGRAIYDQVVPAALAYEQALIDSLSAEDLACLSRLIDTLTDRARAVVEAEAADD